MNELENRELATLGLWLANVQVINTYNHDEYHEKYCRYTELQSQFQREINHALESKWYPGTEEDFAKDALRN